MNFNMCTQFNIVGSFNNYENLKSADQGIKPVMLHGNTHNAFLKKVL